MSRDTRPEDAAPTAEVADVEALMRALADIVAVHGALLERIVRDSQNGGE